METVSLLVRELASDLGTAAGEVKERCAAAAAALKIAVLQLEKPASARAQLEKELRSPLAATAEEPAQEVWARWRAAADLIAGLLREPADGASAAVAARSLLVELPALRDALKQ